MTYDNIIALLAERIVAMSSTEIAVNVAYLFFDLLLILLPFYIMYRVFRKERWKVFLMLWVASLIRW